MKKLLAIALLALLMTAVVGITAVGSGGSNTTGELATTRAVDYLPLEPGYFWIGYGFLDGPITAGQMDIFIVYNESEDDGWLTVQMLDCCILGDEMIGLVVGSFTEPLVDQATSPDSVRIETAMPGNGVALVILGYTSSAEFSAGYHWDIDLLELED